jgi:hypothetical protein
LADGHVEHIPEQIRIDRIAKGYTVNPMNLLMFINGERIHNPLWDKMTTSRGILAKSLSGRGCFFAGRRCKILVMMGITVARPLLTGTHGKRSQWLRVG